MITNIKINNCYVFKEEVNLYLEADKEENGFLCNVNDNILKCVGIFGANNTGKTCLIKCIEFLRCILLKKNFEFGTIRNIFGKNNICELSITFKYDKKFFCYEINYDDIKKEYIYEKFYEIIKNKEELIFIKDIENDNCKIINKIEEEDISYISKISQENILIYSIKDDNEIIKYSKEILVNFANSINILNLNNDIPFEHTINFFKNKKSEIEKIIKFVKNADLYLENIEFIPIKELLVKKILNTEEDNTNNEVETNIENLIIENKIEENILELIGLTSIYKGVRVPSIIFDSKGTKKILALASYIIESIENGKILIIDEIDSSLHFKLVRSIISMFNNEVSKGQLIFTAHDINLLDCKNLFRKDQIWFVHKDDEGVYLYSLLDIFKENNMNLNVDYYDTIEIYKKGFFGAIPEPDLIEYLLSISNLENRNE